MSDPERKSTTIYRINDRIMEFKPLRDINLDPKVHIGLNPVYLQMRQTVHNLGKMHMRARKQKMRELLIHDFLQEDRELRQVDLAYINTQAK